METISIKERFGFAFTYCPKCRVVYYNLSLCDCDIIKEEDDTHQGQLISPRLDYSKALAVEPKINGHKRGEV